MNSLPVISHHLFVEAVASEARAHARPARYDRPVSEVAAPPIDIPLELLDGQNSLTVGATLPLRASAAQTGS